MGDKTKVGIIGTGQIGKNHVRTYGDIPDAEIVAVCDIDEAEAKRVAETCGAKHVLTNFHELLAMDEIEAVDVCLHNNFHAPVAIAAMEAGKHVYCEKPLAGSYADAKAIIEARDRTGMKLAMQQRPLYRPEVFAAKRLIDGGHLGDIYHAKSCGFRRRGRPFVDGYGTATFVQKENAGGGALYDMGVYHISEVLYLIGAPEVLTVSGATHQEIDMYEDRRKSSGCNIEEFAVGFIRLAGGVSFLIEEAWALHAGGMDGSRINGSKGGLTLSPFSYHTTLADVEMDGTFNLKAAQTRWNRCVDDMDAYASAQAHWIAALRGRVEPMDTAGLGLSMMKIAEGIYLSQELGREVTAQEVEERSVSTALQGL